jgi:integration host factor subunit beta
MRARVLLLIPISAASIHLAWDGIEIRGFGSFRVKDKAARKGRNPRTGETVLVPAKKVAAFKPSNEIGDLLNPTPL